MNSQRSPVESCALHQASKALGGTELLEERQQLDEGESEGDSEGEGEGEGGGEGVGMGVGESKGEGEGVG